MSTVFFDVDTQLDFLYPSGALYASGAEGIVPAVAELNRAARARGITVVSTMDAHLENDPEFREWPAHCVAGTLGQRKPGSTLLERQSVVPLAEAAIDASAPQIIVEKRHVDCFTNPNLDRLLEALSAKRCIVYGVVTEICVRHAALGLLQRGKQVEVVTDAVRSLNDARAAEFLGGVRTTTVAEALRSLGG